MALTSPLATVISSAASPLLNEQRVKDLLFEYLRRTSQRNIEKNAKELLDLDLVL